MAWTLGITASHPPGAVALRRDRLPVGERSASGRGGLVAAAKSLLEEAGIHPRDLSLAGVDVGPGSFAGTRMAVALAKALGYAAGCPLGPVSALEARAFSAGPRDVPVALALDARRGRFYGAAFLWEGGVLSRLMDDGLFEHRELRARAPAGAVWLDATFPTAAAVAMLAEASPLRATPFALAPAYLRLVEAQERRLP